jgi:AcrR family transcriptional regulator
VPRTERSTDFGGQAGVDGRRERSRRTATRIVSAALELFPRHGYVGTTIESIADRAGVAVQTVYYLFGSKPRILAAALDTTIAGDDARRALLDRGWEAAISEARDATGAVRGVASLGVAVLARTATVYDVTRRASSIPEVGELLDETRRRRRADQRTLAAQLDARGWLRPEVTVDAAADVIYGLMSEDLFLLMVDDCAWDVERFERWLTRALIAELT